MVYPFVVFSHILPIFKVQNVMKYVYVPKTKNDFIMDIIVNNPINSKSGVDLI